VDYEFLFVVDGRSVEHDDMVARLIEAFDAVVSWDRGCCRLAVSWEGASGEDAFAALVEKLALVAPGLRVLRLDPELVGIADIARRTGRPASEVEQWTHGDSYGSGPFPPAEGTAGRSLVWRWGEVNEWLTPLGLGDGAARPSRAEAARIDVSLLDQVKIPAPPVAAIIGRLGDEDREDAAHEDEGQADGDEGDVRLAGVAAVDEDVRRVIGVVPDEDLLARR
jgi:hypothetical protein